MERINAGGTVPTWNRHDEWDEVHGKRRPLDEVAEVTSATEASAKKRVGAPSPAACLSMRMLAFSEPRVAARRRRAGQLRGAAAPAWRHSGGGSELK